MSTGVIGVLLAQLKLLQYGVQAAPPIEDSGNDLIGVNGLEFRAIQVRTTTTGTYNKPGPDKLYHVLIVVRLAGSGREVNLNDSKLFLLPKSDVKSASGYCQFLKQYAFSRELVEKLFGKLPE
jgi:hypothetical protein